MEQDTRPLQSPYAGPQAVLYFGNKSVPLRLPLDILKPYEELTRQMKDGGGGLFGGSHCTDFALTDIPYGAGHVIVHFLMTGTYQCLSSTRDALKGRKLPELHDLAQQQVAKLGQQLDLLTVISVIEDCTVGYLQFRIQSFTKDATEIEAKDMLARMETPQTLSKILLKSLILMKLPTEPKPEDETDEKTNNVSTERDSVQLAKEAILGTEDAYKRAQERAERETQEAEEIRRAKEQRQQIIRDKLELRELEDMKARDGKLSQSKRRRLSQLREEEAGRAHRASNTEPKQPAEQEPRDEPVAVRSALIRQEQPANSAVEFTNGSDSANKTCM
ncbi:uncharacterized protein FIESC28_01751 [Fusarium coffeatum]|uniref:Uncharacterized protein n=1 Tax=Fusarium coffeatum TaxID=231269 RepID=A0A366S852_9HYPO|nr:uncharacterized protein FIESC28_01751 [Fusarium coffeatum]RBR25513.1 hypothetical protein FIESC28_01751 [Fusarium coffeatum]